MWKLRACSDSFSRFLIFCDDGSLSTHHQPLVAFMLEDKDVAGLTVECFADGLKRRKANCPRLARLEDRKVGERDIDRVRQLGE